ncbi:hypothetical protein LEP1GSC052_1570 [Leptospira kmetyi serovar Malaysia str. Bejo-Iso9]|nr:hypothetical protein LEP1GSC052_1570 [Leptospira kmetyi serovar Malaysia str. Bejo-Iso9]
MAINFGGSCLFFFTVVPKKSINLRPEFFLCREGNAVYE